MGERPSPPRRTGERRRAAAVIARSSDARQLMRSRSDTSDTVPWSRGDPMSSNTRREILIGGAATAGALGAGSAARAVGPPPRPQKHEHGHEHHDHKGYPRTQPGAGGPVGSPTDRGKLVAGLRKPGEPPVPVVTPDLRKLPFQMKGKVKEFHLV